MLPADAGAFHKLAEQLLAAGDQSLPFTLNPHQDSTIASFFINASYFLPSLVSKGISPVSVHSTDLERSLHR